MEGDKLWVQIVSIDTPSSSHRSALLDTQICLLAHHERSASLSHDQLGQLRRRGWAELGPPQAPPTAPCARRAPALHRKAVGAVDGQGKKQVEIGKQEELEGAQERQLPSTFKLPPPRTLPHARTATPMRFHRVLRASAPSHHATWWRAPPSSAASRRVRVSATGQGVPELPCDPSHLPSVHDMGSFISRPVLIFRTILNRATNGFVTAVSRALLGGKRQT